MSKNYFKREDFDDCCPRFIPFERDEGYGLYDIVDTVKLDYVGFIVPYDNIKDCERDCNIMNVLDYLLND